MPPELRFSASSAETRLPATRTSNATVGRIGLEIRRDSAERHQYQSQRPQCCWAWASWDWGWQGGGVLGSLAPRLEELDRISRRVFQQNLRSSGSGDDIVAETDPGTAEAGHLSFEVVDDKVDAVPTAGSGPPPVRHRPAGRARRPTQEEPQVAKRDVRKGRECLRNEREAEMRRVEGQSRLDVVDHVANVDGGHDLPSSGDGSGAAGTYDRKHTPE